MSRRLRWLDDPNGLVVTTIRTLHGRYLTRPSEKVNDIILGILGRAQRMYEIPLYAFTFMSNHNHIYHKVQDEERMALFNGYVNGNIARELGRLHGWKEKFWGRRYHSASVKFTEEDQIARFMYILDNSCKEGLVASPLDWPGVSSAAALFRGEMMMQGTRYDRTAQYRASLRGEYKEFPSTETVHLSPLPFLEERSPEEQRAFYVNAVREIEQKTAEMHERNRTKPIGARAVRRRHPHDKPKSFKPSPAPPFHAVNPDDYRAMMKARKAKVAAYREASFRLRRGETDVEFPEGCFPPRLPFVKPRAPT